MPRSERRFMFLITLILLSAFVLFPFQKVNALAHAGILDQSQTAIDTEYGLYTAPPGFSQSLGQTFTAGLTGSLTEVDLFIGCHADSEPLCATAGDVTVGIHSTDPTGALLDSRTLPSSAFPFIGNGNPTAFVQFLFHSPSVVAGNVYAIVVSTSYGVGGTGPDYSVGASTQNPYLGGTEWGMTNGPPWNSHSNSDLAFQTYVTAVIPEYPLGLPLLAIFMVIAYGLIKRRTAVATN